MAAIIFDFDGTIADTFHYVSDFLAGSAGIASLTDKDRQKLRALSMLAMARQLGHPWWKLPNLFFKGRLRMGEAIEHIQPFTGMPEVIHKLHAEGHELFILSSNNVHNVRTFLKRHGLRTYFLEIYGGVGLFGKAPALRRLIKEHQLDLRACLYIGDELRDVEAAQSLKLRVIAVSWGFAKLSDLQDARPTKLATEPAELLALIEDL